MKKLLTILIAVLGFSTYSVAQVPDLQVLALTAPTDGCALLLNEQVTITVKNAGAADVNGNITYGYSVDGGTPVIEFVPASSILAGASRNYTFTATVDLSTVTSYSFKLWAKVAGDVNVANDTLVNQTVTNLVLPFPYLQDFTANNANQNTSIGPGFSISPTTANSYTWYVKSSSPNSLTGPSADHTPTGLSRFLQVDASKGNVNNVADYETPCINLLNNQTPVLSYWYHMYGNHMGNLYVYAKSTQFPNWVLIDSVIGRQQTSRTQPWRRKVVGLTQFAGQYANIKFSALKTDAGNNGNISIDDFEILDAFPGQGALTKITAPAIGNCNYGSCETVQFSFKNVGRDTLYSVTGEYTVDGGTPVQQTFPLTLAPFKSKILTFSQCADLSAYKVFTIDGQVILSTDLDTTDNISTTAIDHIVPITVPYREPFETFSAGNNSSGNHALGWVASTGSNSFSWTIKNGRSASTSTTIGATGPNSDHTTGNNSGKYFHTDGNKGFPGEVATLESTCIDFTNILAPRLKYWYHRFGFDMGDMFVYVNVDGGWIAVDSIKGESQNSVSDAWKIRTVNIEPFVKGQQARIKFEGTRGRDFATNMAIDDIFIYDLTNYDVGPTRMVKPDTNKFTCYTDNQEFKVSLQNFGALPLDFTVDSVEVKVITTKNGSPWDTASYVVNSNSTNPNSNPLLSDASTTVTFTGIDMSEIGADYGFVVVTNMLSNRDTVPGTDTLRPSNIITRRQSGTAFASSLTVCQGTGVILSDTNFIGAIRWQRQNGTNWVDEFLLTRDSAVHVIIPTQAVNKYRAKICDSTYSNELTINVTQVPLPIANNDTLCGPGSINLSATAPAGITRVFWYNDLTTSGVLTFGNNYTRTLTETDTFYIASQKDSCFSARIPIIGVIAAFPQPGFAAMDTVICNDTTFYLNGGANIGLNATYNWSSNDPTANGKKIQTIGVDPERLNLYTRYWYTVELNSTANCQTIADTAWITISDSCKVGLNENTNIGSLSVFPNPTNGNITLQIETEQANKASLQIISMRGEVIFEEPSFNTLGYNKTFDLSGYAKGIYYMKVISDKGSVVKKVVLQ